MITKKDLQEALDKAILEIVESISRVAATKEDLKAAKNELSGRIDGLSVRVNKVEIELKDVKRTINDLKADLPTPQEFSDHEKRISKLETAVFPS